MAEGGGGEKKRGGRRKITEINTHTRKEKETWRELVIHGGGRGGGGFTCAEPGGRGGEGRRETRRDTGGGGGGTRDNLIQLEMRRPAGGSREASGILRTRWWRRRWALAVAGSRGGGPRQAGHSLHGSPRPKHGRPGGLGNRVCGKAKVAVAGGKADVPTAAGTGGRPVLFRRPPGLGRAGAAGRVLEHELEREREKTLRQH